MKYYIFRNIEKQGGKQPNTVIKLPCPKIVQTPPFCHGALEPCNYGRLL